jgi:putative phage-type endonuclease
MTNISREERIKYIGASEAASLLGVSPYCSRFELWHQKAGNIQAPDLDDVERVLAGKYLEPAIAAWATHKWKWPTFGVDTYLENPMVPGMGASLDFEDEDGYPVEIKNVDQWVFLNEWEADGDTIIDAPIHILVQVQAQLACMQGDDGMKPPHGWLVACVGGNRLYRMKIALHGPTIERIEKEVGVFWEGLKAGIEPKPDFQADAETLIAIYSRAGAKTVDMTDNNRLPELCDEYSAAGAAEKAAQKDKTTAKAEILTLIGDAAKALCGDRYKISAAGVGEAQIAYTRKPYRTFKVHQAKEGTKAPSKKKAPKPTAEGIEV